MSAKHRHVQRQKFNKCHFHQLSLLNYPITTLVLSAVIIHYNFLRFIQQILHCSPYFLQLWLQKNISSNKMFRKKVYCVLGLQSDQKRTKWEIKVFFFSKKCHKKWIKPGISDSLSFNWYKYKMLWKGTLEQRRLGIWKS